MTIKMQVPLEVGICCQDIDVLSRFYQDVLGFTFVAKVVMSDEAAQEVGLSDSGYTVVRLQTPYGERIKLLAPDRRPDAASPGHVLDRLNATYLTFIANGIDELIPSLKAGGATFVTGERLIQLRPGVKAMFCRDPEGNVLELVEYTDLKGYRPDLFADRSA